MSFNQSKKPALISPGKVDRKPVHLSQQTLVDASPLVNGSSLPLLIRPAVKGVEITGWLNRNRDFIDAKLSEHGAILFRDFNLRTAGEFKEFVKAASGDLVEYKERSSPRSQVEDKIYTSTDYPSDQAIFPHNEHSYSRTFPLRLFFFCLHPADSGGETPLIDCRAVMERISKHTLDRFERLKWMYVRNLGNEFGLPWQEVFQTSERSVVEKYCRENIIECEWKPDNGLRTRQVRPVLAKHPLINKSVWFNHLTFFHVSTLSSAMQSALVTEFEEQDLPNNTYYGDGIAIESEVMDELRQAYLDQRVIFAWQKGDVIILDNMLTAHGRMPYTGPRRILFAMSRPFTRGDIQDQPGSRNSI